MLYNVPGRTGVDILPDTVKRLFDDVDNIIGIKEATGSAERTVELLSKIPELYLFSGDDAIDYPLLASGAKGVTSVTSNLLPDIKAKMVHSALGGDYKLAQKINEELFDINKVLFCESNPIPIKAAMYIAGLIPTLEYRLPLLQPSSENMTKIENTMKKYNIVGA
jgi:4-hydroxy-tetrahydrodipicolinate synthase